MAVWDGLESASDNRLRRACRHFSYSFESTVCYIALFLATFSTKALYYVDSGSYGTPTSRYTTRERYGKAPFITYCKFLDKPMTTNTIKKPFTDTAQPTQPQPAIQWTKPLSLLPETEHTAPYPVEALPAIIRNAVTAYQQYGQQPLPLIACSALANASLACQTLANVARDKYLISPVSLYFLVIARSGERKSAADYTFSRAIRQWQLSIRKNLEPELKTAQTLHQAWRVEKEGLLAQIRRNTRLNQDTTSLRHTLLALVANEPEIPLLPALFFEDATQEALASHIATGWPSASLWTDEGGIIMGGHDMQTNSTKFIALLNRLWDGKAFIAHRVH